MRYCTHPHTFTAEALITALPGAAWDRRAVTPGTYTATLLGTAGDQLAVERVIVQQ
jgi:hypothetical protein